MKFFFDNNLPPKLVEAIKCLESTHQVHHLRDGFLPNTEDEQWIRVLGEQGGWVVITRDANIYRNEDERRAWEETHLPIVYVAKAFQDLDFWTMCSKMIQAWPEILAKVGKSQHLAFTLTGSGKLKELN